MNTNPMVTLEGRMGRDPELRFTQTGDAVANFSVVTSNNYKDTNGEWQEKDTSWWRISVWRAQAENVAESLRKGDRVIVIGRAAENAWTDKDGNERKSVEVDAYSVAVPLRFNTVDIKRTQRSAADSRGNGGDDPWAVGSGRSDTSESKSGSDEPPF